MNKKPLEIDKLNFNTLRQISLDKKYDSKHAKTINCVRFMGNFIITGSDAPFIKIYKD